MGGKLGAPFAPSPAWPGQPGHAASPPPPICPMPDEPGAPGEVEPLPSPLPGWGPVWSSGWLDAGGATGTVDGGGSGVAAAADAPPTPNTAISGTIPPTQDAGAARAPEMGGLTDHLA